MRIRTVIQKTLKDSVIEAVSRGTIVESTISGLGGCSHLHSLRSLLRSRIRRSTKKDFGFGTNVFSWLIVDTNDKM